MGIKQKAKEVVNEVEEFAVNLNEKVDTFTDKQIDKSQESKVSWLMYAGAVIVLLSIMVVLAVN